MNKDKIIRKHITKLLSGRGAHVSFENAIINFPFPLTGKIPSGMDHSAWQLLEHMRIAQWDILEFSINANHVSPEFPGGYWPSSAAPKNENDWQQSVDSYQKDLSRMISLIEDTSINLYTEIPHGTGQTILREALLTADHNAYHLGQLVMLRKTLGMWPHNK
jgi:hypothetical protein